MRKGYLSQQHGSSNSLAGSMSGAQNFGSSSNLANPPLNYGSSANLKAQNFGSSNNLASSVGNYSSANLPSVANHGSSANLQAESDFGSSMNLKGSSNNLAGMPGMVNSASHGNLGHLSGGSLGDGLSQHFTPQQVGNDFTFRIKRTIINRPNLCPIAYSWARGHSMQNLIYLLKKRRA